MLEIAFWSHVSLGQLLTVSNSNDFKPRLEVLFFISNTSIYISNIVVAGNLTLKVVNKSYFFNSSYKTYVNGLCFEASATS